MRCHPGTPPPALRESWLGWFLSGLWSRAAVHMLGGGVTWGEEPVSSQSTAVSYSALILCHSHWGRVSRVGVSRTPFHLWESRQGSGVGRPPTGNKPCSSQGLSDSCLALDRAPTLVTRSVVLLASGGVPPKASWFCHPPYR